MLAFEGATIELKPDVYVTVQHPEDKEKEIHFYPKKNEDGTWTLVGIEE